MDPEKLKNLNLEQVTLLANIYWGLDENLDLIHPPRTGTWTRQYETTEEESEFRLDKIWHVFLNAIKSGAFSDKDLYMEIESDYNNTLKIIARIKEMKKKGKIDQRLKNEAWELLEKLVKIHLMLSGEEAKRKQTK